MRPTGLEVKSCIRSWLEFLPLLVEFGGGAGSYYGYLGGFRDAFY